MPNDTNGVVRHHSSRSLSVPIAHG